MSTVAQPRHAPELLSQTAKIAALRGNWRFFFAKLLNTTKEWTCIATKLIATTVEDSEYSGAYPPSNPQNRRSLYVIGRWHTWFIPRYSPSRNERVTL